MRIVLLTADSIKPYDRAEFIDILLEHNQTTSRRGSQADEEEAGNPIIVINTTNSQIEPPLVTLLRNLEANVKSADDTSGSIETDNTIYLTVTGQLLENLRTHYNDQNITAADYCYSDDDYENEFGYNENNDRLFSREAAVPSVLTLITPKFEPESAFTTIKNINLLSQGSEINSDFSHFLYEMKTTQEDLRPFLTFITTPFSPAPKELVDQFKKGGPSKKRGPTSQQNPAFEFYLEQTKNEWYTDDISNEKGTASSTSERKSLSYHIQNLPGAEYLKLIKSISEQIETLSREYKRALIGDDKHAKGCYLHSVLTVFALMRAGMIEVQNTVDAQKKIEQLFVERHDVKGLELSLGPLSVDNKLNNIIFDSTLGYSRTKNHLEELWRTCDRLVTPPTIIAQAPENATNSTVTSSPASPSSFSNKNDLGNEKSPDGWWNKSWLGKKNSSTSSSSAAENNRGSTIPRSSSIEMEL
jgi:hypothetical protein